MAGKTPEQLSAERARCSAAGDTGTLRVIALGIGQHEVVAEIGGVPRPGNEEVYLDARLLEPVTAIKTLSGLEVDQHGLHGGEYGTPTTEQEIAQVRRLAEEFRIERPHVTQSCTLYRGPKCGDRRGISGGAMCDSRRRDQTLVSVWNVECSPRCWVSITREEESLWI